MPADNLFTDLKNALTTFKTFLHDNVGTIKPAVQALKPIVPQITELLDKLISLMTKLKAEINNLNVNAVPGIDKVAQFTAGIKTLLTTAENLLPKEKPEIDEVLGVVEVVSSLPGLGDDVKNQIKGLIDEILADLNNLKS